MKKNKLMTKNKLIQLITIILVFICVYGFLIKNIPWNLIFSNTMVAGGDTGSHNYVAWYSHEIFPKLKWWSPDWYAGFPFLYFYPPLLYYLTDILSFILPLNISFKIITLLGTFLLPLAIFLCLYLLKFSFPIPSLGAVLSLGYLFLEKFSIYGGNIPSTLAGEFSYSFGFALFFIFIGLLFRDLKRQEISVITIITLALMALVHPFSVIAAGLVGILVFGISILVKQAKPTFWNLAAIFGLGFGLSAFWSLPFFMLLGYTSKMSWTKTINISEIFSKSLIPLEIIAGLALIYALIKKEKKVLPLLLIIIAAALPFLLLNHSSIWNTRFLPFILMTILMIASYGLGSWFQLIGKSFIKTIITSILILIGSLYFIVIYLKPTITYIPFWLKWNYEGFETKSSWPEFKSLVDYLKTLPPGRIMWEYRAEYDTFGTPRILENLAIWTNHPTFEGLLIESSLSGYFHFINQAETTKTPTSAIAGLKYPSFNFANGIKHLQLFGAKYFLAYTSDIKKLANQYLKPIATIKSFSVYEVPDAELVTLVPQIELRPKIKGWLDQSINWYEQMDFSKFIVFYQNKKELLEINSSLQPSNTAQSKISVIEIKKDSLAFETENLYQPLLIKITYFPGWRVKGGLGPYLISPSFMMVIPTQKQVTLTFGYNLWDKIGLIITLISVVIIVFLIIQKPYHFLSVLKQKFLTRQD